MTSHASQAHSVVPRDRQPPPHGQSTRANEIRVLSSEPRSRASHSIYGSSNNGSSSPLSSVTGDVSALPVSLAATENETVNTSEVPAEMFETGFITGRGKPALVSKTAYERARKHFGGDEVTSSLEPRIERQQSGDESAQGHDAGAAAAAEGYERKQQREPQEPFVGFTTGSGKKIAVSQSALARAEKLLQGSSGSRSKQIAPSSPQTGTDPAVRNLQRELAEEQGTEDIPSRASSSEIAYGGFTTASGKRQTVSAASLKRAAILLGEESGRLALSTTTSHANSDIHRPDDAVGGEEKVGDDRPYFEPSSGMRGGASASFSGFMTGSGKKLSVSAAARAKATAMFGDLDGDHTHPSDQPQSYVLNSREDDQSIADCAPFSGFTTASGKKPAISAAARAKAAALFGESDAEHDDLFKRSSTSPDSNAQVQRKDESVDKGEDRKLPSTGDSIAFTGFMTASGKKQTLSASALAKAAALLGNAVPLTGGVECDTSTTLATTNSKPAIDPGKLLKDTETNTDGVRSSDHVEDPLTGFTPASERPPNLASPNTDRKRPKPLAQQFEQSAFKRVSTIYGPIQMSSPGRDTVLPLSPTPRRAEPSPGKVSTTTTTPSQQQRETAAGATKTPSMKQSATITAFGRPTPYKKPRMLEGFTPKAAQSVGSPKSNSMKDGRLPMLFPDLDLSAIPTPDEAFLDLLPAITARNAAYLRFHAATVPSAPKPKELELIQSNDSKSAVDRSASQNWGPIISPSEAEVDEPPAPSIILRWANPLLQMKQCETFFSAECARQIAACWNQEIDSVEDKPAPKKLQPTLLSHLKRDAPQQAQQGNLLSVNLLTITTPHSTAPSSESERKSRRETGPQYRNQIDNPNPLAAPAKPHLGWPDAHALLLAAGASTTLLTPRWTRNHYRWVVWRLARQAREKYSSDLSFAPRLLNFAMVMRELVKRYNYELADGKRSVLRRVLERDDPPDRFVVLQVATIYPPVAQSEAAKANATEPPTHMFVCGSGPGGAHLELTDGWYSIPTVLDRTLVRVWLRNFQEDLQLTLPSPSLHDLSHLGFQEGQKLAIFGAKLAQSDDTWKELVVEAQNLSRLTRKAMEWVDEPEKMEETAMKVRHYSPTAISTNRASEDGVAPLDNDVVFSVDRGNAPALMAGTVSESKLGKATDRQYAPLRELVQKQMLSHNSPTKSVTVLKLCANGTRRSSSDAKLGYQKYGCFSVSMDSVAPGGGIVPAVRGVVLRQLPMVYCDFEEKVLRTANEYERWLESEQSKVHAVESALVDKALASYMTNEDPHALGEEPTTDATTDISGADVSESLRELRDILTKRLKRVTPCLSLWVAEVKVDTCEEVGALRSVQECDSHETKASTMYYTSSKYHKLFHAIRKEVGGAGGDKSIMPSPPSDPETVNVPTYSFTGVEFLVTVWSATPELCTSLSEGKLVSFMGCVARSAPPTVFYSAFDRSFDILEGLPPTALPSAPIAPYLSQITLDTEKKRLAPELRALPPRLLHSSPLCLLASVPQHILSNIQPRLAAVALRTVNTSNIEVLADLHNLYSAISAPLLGESKSTQVMPELASTIMAKALRPLWNAVSPDNALRGRFPRHLEEYMRLGANPSFAPLTIPYLQQQGNLPQSIFELIVMTFLSTTTFPKSQPQSNRANVKCESRRLVNFTGAVLNALRFPITQMDLSLLMVRMPSTFGDSLQDGMLMQAASTGETYLYLLCMADSTCEWQVNVTDTSKQKAGDPLHPMNVIDHEKELRTRSITAEDDVCPNLLLVWGLEPRADGGALSQVYQGFRNSAFATETGADTITKPSRGTGQGCTSGTTNEITPCPFVITLKNIALESYSHEHNVLYARYSPMSSSLIPPPKELEPWIGPRISYIEDIQSDIRTQHTTEGTGSTLLKSHDIVANNTQKNKSLQADVALLYGLPKVCACLPNYANPYLQDDLSFSGSLPSNFSANRWHTVKAWLTNVNRAFTRQYPATLTASFRHAAVSTYLAGNPVCRTYGSLRRARSRCQELLGHLSQSVVLDMLLSRYAGNASIFRKAPQPTPSKTQSMSCLVSNSATPKPLIVTQGSERKAQSDGKEGQRRLFAMLEEAYALLSTGLSWYAPLIAVRQPQSKTRQDPREALRLFQQSIRWNYLYSARFHQSSTRSRCTGWSCMLTTHEGSGLEPLLAGIDWASPSITTDSNHDAARNELSDFKASVHTSTPHTILKALKQNLQTRNSEDTVRAPALTIVQSPSSTQSKLSSGINVLDNGLYSSVVCLNLVPTSVPGQNAILELIPTPQTLSLVLSVLSPKILAKLKAPGCILPVVLDLAALEEGILSRATLGLDALASMLEGDLTTISTAQARIAYDLLKPLDELRLHLLGLLDQKGDTAAHIERNMDEETGDRLRVLLEPLRDHWKESELGPYVPEAATDAVYLLHVWLYLISTCDIVPTDALTLLHKNELSDSSTEANPSDHVGRSAVRSVPRRFIASRDPSSLYPGWIAIEAPRLIAVRKFAPSMAVSEARPCFTLSAEAVTTTSISKETNLIYIRKCLIKESVWRQISDEPWRTLFIQPRLKVCISPYGRVRPLESVCSESKVQDPFMLRVEPALTAQQTVSADATAILSKHDTESCIPASALIAEWNKESSSMYPTEGQIRWYETESIRNNLFSQVLESSIGLVTPMYIRRLAHSPV